MRVHCIYLNRIYILDIIVYTIRILLRINKKSIPHLSLNQKWLFTKKYDIHILYLFVGGHFITLRFNFILSNKRVLFPFAVLYCEGGGNTNFPYYISYHLFRYRLWLYGEMTFSCFNVLTATSRNYRMSLF